jgi:hypothetical protein
VRTFSGGWMRCRSASNAEDKNPSMGGLFGQ